MEEHKITILKICLSALLLAAASVLPIADSALLLIYLAAYGIVGFEVIREAAAHIGKGQVFDEDFLMIVATIGAFAIGQYAEAVFVMLLFCLGELFEDVAVNKTRRSITSLMDMRPDTVTVLREGGEVVLQPDMVEVGEIFIVRPGERIPLDGCIIEGTTDLTTAMLTGESVPVSVTVGDEVLSGCVNESGVIRVEATRKSGDSSAARMLALIEDAAERKTKAEGVITRFSRYYTPIVVLSALLIAVLPPLFYGQFGRYIAIALNFLVVSCPCALVISIPLTYFSGLGALSRRGILVKGSDYLEELAKCGTMVFDKTGTLTEGKFKVKEVFANGIPADLLRQKAALSERYSRHPIAAALLDGCPVSDDNHNLRNVKELAGRGVAADIDGGTVYAGNLRLMNEVGITPGGCPEKAGTVVYLAEKKGDCAAAYLGCIVVGDQIRSSAYDALSALRKCGVRKLVMLTGDRREIAEEVSASLGLDDVQYELLPEGKVRALNGILGQRKAKKTVAFVGDGVNDAPVLALADIGIAMGGIGSDAAVSAADAVIMNDDLNRIPDAVRAARKTVRIVRENISFSVSVKMFVLICSLFGICPLWLAVFSDVGVMMLAVLNALRAFHMADK